MRYIFFFLLSGIASLSQASIWEGKVEKIEVTLTNRVILFKLSGSLEDSPRCNEKGMYALDSGLPSGRIALDLLRSAYESGRSVTAQGLNTCSAHFQAEGLKFVTFR